MTENGGRIDLRFTKCNQSICLFLHLTTLGLLAIPSSGLLIFPVASKSSIIMVYLRCLPFSLYSCIHILAYKHACMHAYRIQCYTFEIAILVLNISMKYVDADHQWYYLWSLFLRSLIHWWMKMSASLVKACDMKNARKIRKIRNYSDVLGCYLSLYLWSPRAWGSDYGHSLISRGDAGTLFVG